MVDAVHPSPLPSFVNTSFPRSPADLLLHDEHQGVLILTLHRLLVCESDRVCVREGWEQDIIYIHQDIMEMCCGIMEMYCGIRDMCEK